MTENNKLSLTAYGAASDIGKSAFLISHDGRKVLLDCGVQIQPRRTGKKSLGINELLPIAESLTSVIISHSHLDHTGFIPALYRAGFKGKTYGTKPSKEIVKVLWDDHLKIEGNHHFTKENVDKALANFQTFSYGSKIKVAEGVFAILADAGHILGSSQVILDFDGMVILYTGDVNDQNTPFHDRARPFSEPVDILLTETTNGNRPMPPRKQVAESLIGRILETIRRGGKFIIPAFAVGRSQEMQSYLVDALPDVPVYVDGMILKMNAIYEKYMNKEWVSEKALESFADAGLKSPFESPGFIPVSRDHIDGNLERFRKSIAQSKKPAVILTTSGMLEGGPVHSYLRWQTPADTLGIVGYQAEGTIGWEIKHGSRNIKAVTPWKEEIAINLDLSIEVFQFSGHASSQGLLELIKANKPARIFPVHGAKIAQSDFREYLGKANLHLESLDLRSPVILAT